MLSSRSYLGSNPALRLPILLWPERSLEEVPLLWHSQSHHIKVPRKVGGDLSQEGKSMHLGQRGGSAARVSTRFHSESQVTMTDQPPERTDFRGSMKFRFKTWFIRREAWPSSLTYFWSAATGRSDSGDQLRERPRTNLHLTP